MSLSFKMVSGDSKVLNITAKTSAGAVIDITGATITWSLFSSGTAILTKTVSSGITITDATNGVFSVTLSPSDTASLEGEYIAEVELTVSGNVMTLREDKNLKQGIVRIQNDLIT